MQANVRKFAAAQDQTEKRNWCAWLAPQTMVRPVVCYVLYVMCCMLCVVCYVVYVMCFMLCVVLSCVCVCRLAFSAFVCVVAVSSNIGRLTLCVFLFCFVHFGILYPADDSSE
jgi:hypothetical protein